MYSLWPQVFLCLHVDAICWACSAGSSERWDAAGKNGRVLLLSACSEHATDLAEQCCSVHACSTQVA